MPTPDRVPFTVFVDAAFDEDGFWVIDARLEWRDGTVPAWLREAVDQISTAVV